MGEVTSDPVSGREAEIVAVDVQRFKEAVWDVERENFRPGDALNALERATARGTGWQDIERKRRSRSGSAAEEVERLREALAAIADGDYSSGARNIANAALAGKRAQPC